MKKLDDIVFIRKQDITRGEPKAQVEDKPAVYEFRVRSRLSHQWVDWFDGLKIGYDDLGNTLISGEIPDQAALHGILRKIRDLNLILVSINRKG